MKAVIWFSCSRYRGRPSKIDVDPEPQVALDRANPMHRCFILGSPGGTRIGKHGGSFTHVSLHPSPSLKRLVEASTGVKSRSWSRNCPHCITMPESLSSSSKIFPASSWYWWILEIGFPSYGKIKHSFTLYKIVPPE